LKAQQGRWHSACLKLPNENFNQGEHPLTTLHLSRRTLLGSLGAGLLMSASRGAMAARSTR
jgi:hypothetical protein